MRFITESNWKVYCEIRDDVAKLESWKERIERCMPGSKFYSPATERDFENAEVALGHELPETLREVLRESNGVDSPYSPLFYSTRSIVEVNQKFRDPDFLSDLSMPFDHLLFFGTVSDGDEFALPKLKNGSFANAVFIWSHESDCREEYANGFFDYLLKYTVELYRPYMEYKKKELA